MGDLSKHFSQKEFVCSCCGRYKDMSKLLIEMLEKVYDYMNAKAINISSGYRCENNPWGYKNDAHRKAISENKHDFIDSCTMMSHYGHKLDTVIGPMENIKITTPTDFFVLRAMIKVHEDQQIFGL